MCQPKFVWSDFLKVAQQLASNDEAANRSAVSRAYYAVFCSARDRLKGSNVIIPKNADSHQMVRDLYSRCGDYEAKKIVADLDRMRIMRNNADYDLILSDDHVEACKKAISMAEKSLLRLDQFPESLINEIKQKS